MLEESLYISINNVSNHFTFFRGEARTIIDVTLSTPNVREKIDNWSHP